MHLVFLVRLVLGGLRLFRDDYHLRRVVTGFELHFLKCWFKTYHKG
jgi:hypothetical protein